MFPSTGRQTTLWFALESVCFTKTGSGRDCNLMMTVVDDWLLGGGGAATRRGRWCRWTRSGQTTWAPSMHGTRCAPLCCCCRCAETLSYVCCVLQRCFALLRLCPEPVLMVLYLDTDVRASYENCASPDCCSREKEVLRRQSLSLKSRFRL
jgi:hypothetical protein